jgi:glycosyltransferase involved in cell wall biosynthesis
MVEIEKMSGERRRTGSRASAATPVHYIVWGMGPGGAELGIRNFIKHFGDQRPLYVYGIRQTTDKIYANQPNVRITHGSKRRWQPYFQYFQYCRRHKNDIFHLKNGGPMILLLSLLAGVRFLIYHIHGTIYWRSYAQKLLLKPVWLLSNLFLWRAENIQFVAVSAYSASVFRDRVLPIMPKVVYNGFEVKRFTMQKRLRVAPRRIGYAGRLYPGKNVDLVIRVFNEIAINRPELELHIAGSGHLRQTLEDQARNSPCGARITFHGMVQDMPAFYGQMDLLLFFSAYESFGNVVAEALLTGLPVLASNVPSFKEIFGEHCDFIMGDPADYEGIKYKVARALEHFPVLAHKAQVLSDVLSEKFDLALHLAKIKNLYETH